MSALSHSTPCTAVFFRSMHGYRDFYKPTFVVPRRDTWAKKTLDRRARGFDEDSISADQFAKAKKPFEFPVNTKKPIEERKLSARHMMTVLKDEERDRIRAKYPREADEAFRPGDAVAVTQLLSLQEDKMEVLKGVVLEKRKKNQLASHFVIRNAVMDFHYEMMIPTHAPFIKKVEVLAKRGKVRRAKLFYYRDLPASDKRVKPVL